MIETSHKQAAGTAIRLHPCGNEFVPRRIGILS